jgi:glycosyltransferase involved in cell wall biosynthesis
MTHVTLWGRRPPPMGGVTRSVARLCRTLEQSRIDYTLIDAGQPLRGAVVATRALVRRDTVSVCNVSNPSRLPVIAVLSHVARHPFVVYFHGNIADRLVEHRASLIRWYLARAHQIWVNNDLVKRSLANICSIDSRVVSPWSTQAPLHAPSPSCRNDSTHVVVAAMRGADTYGVEVAVRAVQLARERLPDVRLTIVLYGRKTRGENIPLHPYTEASWLSVCRDLSPEEMSSLLTATDIVLRPTSADGDSLLVREALALGCRVIASPVVPRPAGVELAEVEADALCEALIHGGALSDGSGMGVSVASAIFDLLGQAHGPESVKIRDK